MSVFQNIVIVIVIPVIVAVITTFIFSNVYKRKDKVDKGIELNYFKLSHRRKMVRTLISSPILIIGLIVLYFFSNGSLAVYITFVSIVLLALCIQLIYHYKMWKKEEGREW
ncbi:hypothetical protein BHU72_09225 [Desulfuribacillus stibiiarsenatis]|uniref:Uncharacterized protein n=1 Tax=Desulfuribacillus stibiiarsenatis TaxID=1390249 RepID=A0A1E5L3R7_9FIRM|nr:hypothetical protein [Desulfuribacillus stibiiarsenatis]OEH84663.1 hypothetical protein BHU72_09225 [Desulfuribacillus stibiiarsenatis]